MEIESCSSDQSDREINSKQKYNSRIKKDLTFKNFEELNLDIEQSSLKILNEIKELMIKLLDSHVKFQLFNVIVTEDHGNFFLKILTPKKIHSQLRIFIYNIKEVKFTEDVFDQFYECRS